MTLRARFANRWIVVTETVHVVKKPSFRYRSYARRNDAQTARERPIKTPHFDRRYIVDRDNPGNVILP